ncbi:MAG TPA: glycosyltransferase family 4 protein, partial [Microthrixaceae bacterium]|nr:glycosyltransferase family 4 protein [Microthrixaceae bacterium]
VHLIAQGLAAEGHEVEVLTSCADDYKDWTDAFPPGVTTSEGVTLRRLRVIEPRDNDQFLPLHARAIEPGHPPLWPWSQDRWTWQMGPALADGEAEVAALARRSDVTVMVCYHYLPAMRLTKVAAANGPVCLQTTAHPEGAFQTGAVRPMMHFADLILCEVPEEADLVHDTTGLGHKTRTAPCPIDEVATPSPEEIGATRARLGIADAPYLVTVGRPDAGKGTFDAVEFTRLARRSVLPELQLVIVGPLDDSVKSGPGVTTVGVLDEVDKTAVIAGADALLQPSYMESLSIVLLEGWLLGRPAIVNGRCAVLAGQARRSGGAVVYDDFGDFEAGVSWLLGDEQARERLGANGGEYARANYSWPAARDQFLGAVEEAITIGNTRLGRARRGVRPTV